MGPNSLIVVYVDPLGSVVFRTAWSFGVCCIGYAGMRGGGKSFGHLSTAWGSRAYGI